MSDDLLGSGVLVRDRVLVIDEGAGYEKKGDQPERWWYEVDERCWSSYCQEALYIAPCYKATRSHPPETRRNISAGVQRECQHSKLNGKLHARETKERERNATERAMNSMGQQWILPNASSFMRCAGLREIVAVVARPKPAMIHIAVIRISTLLNSPRQPAYLTPNIESWTRLLIFFKFPGSPT